MSCEVARLSEALLTAGEIALIRFFTCVCSQMRPQVEIKGKRLGTELALEGLFSLDRFYSVNQHMSAQLGVVKELLSAGLDRTDELTLSVSQCVLAERPAVCEHFTAV